MTKPQTPPKRGLIRCSLKQVYALSGLFVVALILFTTLALNVHHTPVSAATNATLNFQARLQTNTGAIVPDGTYNIRFKLYNVSSGGAFLWSETYQNSAAQGVTVTNGYVSVNLGSLTAFPGTINWDQNLYLTMDIAGTSASATPTYDGEMTPRLQLTSVPYAFRAGSLATYNGATTFTSTLSILAPTGGNQTFQIPDQTAAGTYSLLTTNTANASFIQLQAGTPGVAQTGNFNISGTGIAGILQATTSVKTPTLDTATGVALNIGATNATSIALGKAGVSTAVNANLSVVGTGQIGGTPAQVGELSILNTTATQRVLTLQAAVGQTAAYDILDLYNSGGSFVSGYDINGNLFLNGALQSGTGSAAGQLRVRDGSTGFKATLTVTGALGADRTINLPDESGILCIRGSANCGFAAGTAASYIQNQNLSQQAGTFWINGSGRADTSLLTPLLDTATGVALTVGNTNATAINIGKTTSNITTTVTGLTVVKPSAGNDSATAFQVQNAAGNQALVVDTTADARNLITNSGFETNTTGWVAKGAASIARSTAQSYFGKASMLITTTAAANDGVKYNLTLSPNTNYTFVVDFLTTGGMSTLVDGYSSDGATETTYVSTGYGNAAGAWSSATIAFTTPATFSGTPYFFIKQTDATARSIYVDAAEAFVSTGGQIGYNESRASLGPDAATMLGINTTSPNAALEVDQKINQTGLLVRGAGAITNVYEQLAFDVQSSNGNSHLQYNEITDTVGVHGGNAFWNSAALDVFSDDPGGRGIAVTGNNVTAQTGDLLQVWSGAGSGRTNTKMFGIDGNGTTIHRNYANTTAAFQVQNAGGTAVLGVDTTNARLGVGTAASAPGYTLDVQSTSTAITGSNINANSTYTVAPASAPASTTFYIGTQNVAQTSSANANANTSLIGALGRTQVSGSAAFASGAGLQGDVYNSGSGILALALGLTAAVVNNGTGSITNAHAIDIQAPGAATGSIGTATGLYIQSQKVTGVTTGYGIYQAGASDTNYFAGQMLIQNTSTAALRVNTVGGTAAFIVDTTDGYSYFTSPAGTTSLVVRPGYCWNGSSFVATSGCVDLDIGGTNTLRVSDNFSVLGGTLSISPVGNAAWYSGFKVAGHVDGTGGGSSCGAKGCSVVTFNDGGGASQRWAIGVDGTGYFNLMTENGTTSSSRLQIQNVNTCTIANGTAGATCTSDARLKNVSGAATDNLAKIMQLQPTYYSWKSDPTKQTYMGLIAQNVQTVLPEMVQTNSDGYLGLSYSNLTVPLIGAVQEQQAEIQGISSQVSSLDSYINGGNFSGSTLNISGAAQVGSLTVVGDVAIGHDLHVAGTTYVQTLSIEGHLVTAGNVPQIVMPSGLGSDASVTVDGNDTAGTVTITTGSQSATSGDLATLLFANAFAKNPHVMLQPVGLNSAQLQLYVDQATDHFTVATTTTWQKQHTYQFNYMVMQ